MSRYENEFDATKMTVPDFLFGQEWEDVSWHNDACASWHNRDLLLCVWVDYDDPADREMNDYQADGAWKKFNVSPLKRIGEDEYVLDNDDTAADLFQTDDPEKLEQWLKLYEARGYLERAVDAINNAPKPDECVADELHTAIAYLNEHMEDLKEDK